jgi:hypothetical protein
MTEVPQGSLAERSFQADSGLPSLEASVFLSQLQSPAKTGGVFLFS